MQDQTTWTIIEIRDGERNEVATGASHVQALGAIRSAMYGEAESLFASSEQPVPELSLAA